MRYVTALAATLISFLWGSAFVVIPFSVGDTVGLAPVCSIAQYAPPIWDGFWTYGINGLSVMVLGMPSLINLLEQRPFEEPISRA